MAKHKEKLLMVNLLDQLLFVKNRASEDYKLQDVEIKQLKFVRKNPDGTVTYVGDFKLNIATFQGEKVIIMLPE